MPIMLMVGPRQCGKTTLSKTIGHDLKMGYISCDNIATLASIQFDPAGFLNNQAKPLIIDEAQRAPEILLQRCLLRHYGNEALNLMKSDGIQNM